MIWATVSSQSCFCRLYRASPSLAAKNIINLILVLTIWWCPCVESSVVFLYFLALITEDAFLSLLAILWNSAFKWVYLSFSLLLFTSLLFTAICKPSSDSHFAFCISFSWGWSWSLPPVQCHKPLSIVLQALCLSDLIPWICLSFPVYNHKGFDWGHTWMI